MQDTNQNRQQGQQGQQTQDTDTNWNKGGTQNDNDNRSMSADTEINTPQQPRHTEEPMIGGTQGSSGSQQMDRTQAGGTSGMGSDSGNDGNWNRQGSNSDSSTRSGMGGMSGQSGQTTGQGSMSDQGTMGNQRGDKMNNNANSDDSGNDDYMRNDIGRTGSNSGSDYNR